MKTVLLVLSVVLLAGCATNSPRPPVPTIGDNTTKVEIDENLLMECADFPTLERSTKEKVLEYIADAGSKYEACASAKRELNTIARKAFKIEEKKEK